MNTYPTTPDAVSAPPHPRGRRTPVPLAGMDLKEGAPGTTRGRRPGHVLKIAAVWSAHSGVISPERPRSFHNALPSFTD